MGFAMRILFVSHSHAPGGAQSCLGELVSHCVSAGDECAVIGPRSGPWLDQYQRLGVPVIRIPLADIFRGSGLLWRAKVLLRLVLNVLQIAMTIRRFHPDLVYTNTSTIPAGAIAAKLMKVRHIWHVHENLSTLPVPYAAGMSTLRRMITGFSDRIVFVSQCAMNGFYPQRCDKAVSIHNGVDVDRFQRCLAGKDSDGRHVGATDGIRLGFVGALSPVRGVDVLLEAFALLKNEHPHLVLHLWGTGKPEYIQHVSELAKLFGVPDSVKLMGYARNVAEIMPDYDVLVVPSRSESFSRVALEAMAAGVPLVATRCGGPEDYVEDGVTGRLVAVGDVHQLADAVDWVLKNPEQSQKMAQRAQQKVRTDFRLEDKLREIRAIIQQVVQGK